MSDNNNVSTKKQDINDDNQQEKFVPELRFPEFTDEWRSKKLGDLSDVTKLAGFEFTKYVNYSDNGNIIALRGVNIKKNKLDLTDVKYIDNSDFNKLNRSKLYPGDLLFTYVGTIGNVALIFKKNKYYLAPNVCRIRSESFINSQFLKFYFNTQLIKKEINRYVTKSSQPALSMENIRKFNVNIPNIKEQNKIANFISLIDRKIDLLERKQNLVLNEKFITIQKLILKIKNENPKVPLDEIFNFKKGKGLSKNKVSNEGKYKAILYGELYTTYNEIPDKIISFTNCDEGVLSEKGDLLIPASTTTNGIDLINSTIINEEGVHLGGDINILRNKHNVQINSLFIGIFLEYGLRKEIFRLTQGSTIIHLYGKDLKKLNVNLPSIEKQNKISELFKYYLNKEKLIENKIKMMKNYKKALLQQMFV